MSSQREWEVKADLRSNHSREKTRRNVNIKYSNRELSPLNRNEAYNNNSKFVQSNVIKPLNKLISNGAWNSKEEARPIN